METSEDPAIQFSTLSKRFGAVQALSDVSFAVPRGSLCALVGPNGAGKTTLLSLAAGFLRPDSGAISMLGAPVPEGLPSLRGRFSMLVQDAGLPRNGRVQNTLHFLARLAGAGKEEAQHDVDRVLELLGLSAHKRKKIRQLSHGMLKRVHVAQAFLGHPELIFLDEPTAGLDPENAAQLRRVIAELAGPSTVVLSSHNLGELEEICTDLVLLNHGNIVFSGSMSDFLRGGSLIRFTLDAPPTQTLLNTLQALPNVESVSLREETHLHITYELSPGETRPTVVRRVLHTLLSADNVPRTMSEGARLEARFLEEILRDAL